MADEELMEVIVKDAAFLKYQEALPELLNGGGSGNLIILGTMTNFSRGANGVVAEYALTEEGAKLLKREKEYE